MGLEFLKTLVIIFGVSATVVFILHKFRIPSIVGFLLAGVFLGPHGFGFVQDISEVELLADAGLVHTQWKVTYKFDDVRSYASRIVGSDVEAAKQLIRYLVETVGTEELKNAVVTLHPQSAAEHLHHLFVAAGGDGSDATYIKEGEATPAQIAALAKG